MKLTQQQRKQIRQLAGLKKHDHPPVEVVPGDSPPVERGEAHHWETATGIRICYPSAYAKVGWSSMTYICSSRRVEVGIDWVSTNI